MFFIKQKVYIRYSIDSIESLINEFVKQKLKKNKLKFQVGGCLSEIQGNG